MVNGECLIKLDDDPVSGAYRNRRSGFFKVTLNGLTPLF